MRIAIVTSCAFPPFGGSRIIDLFKHLSKRHEIHIFHLGSHISEDRDFSDGSFFVHTVKPPLDCLPYLEWFVSRLSTNYFPKRIKRFGRFDCLYMDCITPWASLVRLAMEKLEIPLFSDYCDPEWVSNRLYRTITTGILAKCFANSRHIFPACSTLAERLMRFYGIRADLITKIPNGVDTTVFRPIHYPHIRERLGLSDNIVIGFCGMMNRWVRLDVLLTAFKQIRNDHQNAKLLIVGRGSETERWRKHSVDLGISEDVVFAGFVPFQHVPYYMASFDIAVSIFEKSYFAASITPLKVVQYLSMGKAVVADDLPGTREYIRDMNTGILFEPENSKSLKAALDTILKDKTLKGRLERNARSEALNYDWRNLSQRLENVIVSLK